MENTDNGTRPEVADGLTDRQMEFLDLLDAGSGPATARKNLGISRYIFNKWMLTDSFRQAFEARQEETKDILFEKLDDALNIYPNAQQAKVFSDNLRWKLSKLDPSRFGDSLNLKASMTIDVSERFMSALARLDRAKLRPVLGQSAIIDLEPEHVSPLHSDMSSEGKQADTGTGKADGLTARADSTGGTRAGETPNAPAQRELPPSQTNRDG